VIVNVTFLNPVVVKQWRGFRAVLLPPSPKSQSQDCGIPVEVSVNWTEWSTRGYLGPYVKDALRLLAGRDERPVIRLRIPVTVCAGAAEASPRAQKTEIAAAIHEAFMGRR
jgi:hypothetical protein